MPAANLPFSSAEYDRRLAKTRAEMAARGLEALFVTDPSNQAWLTGYDGWSFYVHQGVIVLPDADPIWWGRNQDTNGALRTVWMSPDRVRGYADGYVQSTERHPMQDLAKHLLDLGLRKARIGVEMDNYYFSAKAMEVMRAELPDAAWQDATALVNWQRAVKSETELDYMRKASRIVERMHDRILEIMEPGKRRNEVAAEIYKTGIWGSEEEGVSFGGDYPAIAPLMPTGMDATAAHLTWDDRVFEKGAGTFFEIAGCYRRYHAPMCRTVYLGTPPDDMLRAEEAALEGIEAGIAMARAGNTAGDVARAFYEVLLRRGIEREGRCGYPIGLSYPPDWGERTFSIRPTDSTVLEPNMTFHFMPALWMEEWGLEVTEPLRIRESGPAECLADYPRKLFVKP